MIGDEAKTVFLSKLESDVAVSSSFSFNCVLHFSFSSYYKVLI